MATFKAATAFLVKNSGIGSRHCRSRSTRSRSTGLFLVSASVQGLFLLAATPAVSASNKVRISNLGDVAFGTVANLGVDAVRSQSLCLYSDSATNHYNITAAGTGPAGAFQLSSGPATLAYEVQWSSSSGQSSGTQLTPNVPLTGQLSAATQQSCGNGPTSSASLVIVLRSGILSSATAGTYNGTLTLVVGPE